MSLSSKWVITGRDEEYDWRQVFTAAGVESGHNGKNLKTAIPGDATTPLTPFGIADVKEVLHMREGENDGPEWIVIVSLEDGRYAFLAGGCEYSGWDREYFCEAFVAMSYGDIVRFGASEGARARFGIEIDGEERRRV